mmetsp:Transcript_3346/g.5952  ORF Transcript_3346/g.5952 Transcript_3346/m.5952 type:complete len:255 (+) Transcript_3346:141-905(+)
MLCHPQILCRESMLPQHSLHFIHSFRSPILRSPRQSFLNLLLGQKWLFHDLLFFVTSSPRTADALTLLIPTLILLFWVILIGSVFILSPLTLIPPLLLLILWTIFIGCAPLVEPLSPHFLLFIFGGRDTKPLRAQFHSFLERHFRGCLWHLSSVHFLARFFPFRSFAVVGCGILVFFLRRWRISSRRCCLRCGIRGSYCRGLIGGFFSHRGIGRGIGRGSSLSRLFRKTRGGSLYNPELLFVETTLQTNRKIGF